MADKIRRIPGKFDRRDWMSRGAGFLKAASILGERLFKVEGDNIEFADFSILAVPTLICETFSIETLMKVLAFDSHGNNPIATHDLTVLFADIGEVRRFSVESVWTANEMPTINASRNCWPKHLPPPPRNLAEALALGSHSFTSWRYGQTGSPWWLRGLALVLLQVANGEIKLVDE